VNKLNGGEKINDGMQMLLVYKSSYRRLWRTTYMQLRLGLGRFRSSVMVLDYLWLRTRVPAYTR